MKPRLKSLRHWLIALSAIFFAGPVIAMATAVDWGADWRTASRQSAKLAPDPAAYEPAVIQVYGARTMGLRGAFGVHTWIATKRTGDAQYTVHHVLGWRKFRDLPVVETTKDIPDRYWYSARPELYADLRGPGVDKVIDKVHAAIKAYPYMYDYVLWPGPNSNTFTAHVGRSVPELGLDLPPTAVGKDYIPGPGLFAETPSGTGYQVSLFGVLGILAGWEEGIEVNVLSLSVGVDPKNLALRLPGLGHVGFDTKAEAKTLP